MGYLWGRISRNVFTVLLLLGMLFCSQPVEESSSAEPSETSSVLTRPALPEEPPISTPVSPAQVSAAAHYRQVGLDLRSQGQLEDAIAAFQQGVALDASNLNGHVILGWTQHLAGQPDAAVESLQAALTIDANYVPALNALGIVHLVDGQLTEAKRVHLEAVELQPDNETAHYNLSLTFQRLEDLELAVRHARQATELEPHNPHPWVALAIALRSQNKIDAANQAYGQALQLDARYGNRDYLSHLLQAGFSPAQIDLSDTVRRGE